MSSQTSRRSIRNEARPLGTPSPKKLGKRSAAKAARAKQQLEPDPRAHQSDDDSETAIEASQKEVDSPPPRAIESPQTNGAAFDSAPTELQPPIQKEHTVHLTFKGLSKNGKQAIYVGARTNIRIATASFEGQPDQTIDLNGATLLGAKQPKQKLSAEERKALRANKPKSTLAERAAKAKERADKLAALAAQEANA